MSKEAIEHYEAALKEAFPSGATGDVFHHWNEARKELAEQPAQDNTYGYAKYLAEAMFKRHFASDEHYASGRVVWGVNDTVIGILTQIDNMVADMVRRPAQQEPVAWMDGYRNIYSLEEKAAGCAEATIALVPMANQEKTSGSPINELQCVCGAVWLGEEMVHLPDKRPPAQRTWVGLTDEQWQSIADTLGCFITRGQKDAIEATIGIKGDA